MGMTLRKLNPFGRNKDGEFTFATYTGKEWRKKKEYFIHNIKI